MLTFVNFDLYISKIKKTFEGKLQTVNNEAPITYNKPAWTSVRQLALQKLFNLRAQMFTVRIYHMFCKVI